MLRFWLSLSLALDFVSAGLPDLEQIKRDAADNKLPKMDGTPAGFEKTRLLFLEYSYKGESVIYDRLENKKAAKSHVIEAKYTWETLHSDDSSSMFSRLKFVRCVSGDCGTDLPDIYVHSILGGNNLVSIYMDLTGKPKDYKPAWNWMLGIMSTVYTPAEHGAGDVQLVDSVFGECIFEFSRPQDKRFKRQIRECNLAGAHNYTRFDGLTKAKFTQDVLYVQNVKLDADIVIIEAVEELALSSPVDPKWSVMVESRLRIEMENRTRNYVLRHCGMDTSVEDCAEKHFNLTKISLRKFEGFDFRPPRPNEFGNAVARYRDHLFEMGPSHTCEEHSRLYSEIAKYALTASSHDFVEAIKAPENEPVLHAIAHILGTIGTVDALQVAREVLFIEAADTLSSYLFGAATSIATDEKWHKQLMYWLIEQRASGEDDSFWQIANALATILRRRCDASPSSRNACEKGKEKIVEKFTAVVSSCDDDDCVERSLLALENLPLPSSYAYARKFVCFGRSARIETAALKVIRAVPSKYYESPLIKAVVNVFRDVCKTPTNLHHARIAVDILLDSVLEHQTAATLLLRGENDVFRDAERWSYFYKAVAASRAEDENKDVVWRRMRAFRVFRPNWSQRALGAKSTAFYAALGESLGYTADFYQKAFYSDGIFQGSELEIALTKKRQHYSLFNLELSGTGHDAFVRKLGEAGASTPRIEARLGILGHKLDRKVLVNSEADLMAEVWGADGHTIQAFEGNALLRAYDGAFPLMSGLTVGVDSFGSMNTKVLGSIGISLWERTSDTRINVNISASLDLTVTLYDHQQELETISAQASIVSSIGSITDVDFASIPPVACTQTSRLHTSSSFKSEHEDHSSDKKQILSAKNSAVPGQSLPMDDSLVRMCQEHNELLGKLEYD